MLGAQTIVILHGWGAESSRWEGVKKLLEERGFSVFIPDLPCFGKEACPNEAWGVDEYASWVAQKIQNRGLSKVILIGHSFGGSVAAKVAVNHASLVSKLILVNSAGIRIPQSSLKLKVWLPIVHLGNWVFNLPVLRNFEETIRKGLYRLLGSVDYFKAEGVKKEILQKILREDISNELKRITSPTLIVWGEKDRQAPVKWARIFHQNIRGSTLKTVEGGDHVFPYYKPELFVKLIEGFFSRRHSD